MHASLSGRANYNKNKPEYKRDLNAIDILMSMDIVAMDSIELIQRVKGMQREARSRLDWI